LQGSSRPRFCAGGGGSRPKVTLSRAYGGLASIYWDVGLSFPVLVALAVWNIIATRVLADLLKRPIFLCLHLATRFQPTSRLCG
jgi:hypothetical protein